MKKDEDAIVEILTGATAAILGGTILAIPYYGFVPLGSALAGLFVVAAVGRKLRQERNEANNKKTSRPRRR